MPPEALTAANGTTFTTQELFKHWHLFGIWAYQTGVSLVHSEDYLPWWECYLTGAFNENQRS